MDRTFATEPVSTSSILGRIIRKHKNWYSPTFI